MHSRKWLRFLALLVASIVVLLVLPPNEAVAWCPSGDACHGPGSCEELTWPFVYSCTCYEYDACGRCCLGLCCIYNPHHCWWASWLWCGCDCN